jgi:hypothetical protein
MINTTRPLILALAVAAAFSLSCGDDSTTPPPPKTPTFQNLSHRSDVLNNFEAAHNRNDPNHYNALLDDNFTFFYTESDAGGGGTPFQWGRDVDVPATAAMFAAASRIDMLVDFHDGVTWIEVPSGAETWYATTVFYHFTIKIGDTTYIPNAGAKMSFTVRNAGTAEAPQWRLVELRDLGGPSVFNANSPASSATSYGKVKALYR